MYRSRLLFLIIIIEGYVVLASELLAIRQLIPFVGSGIEIVAIIISSVLLPLAAGYYIGGNAYKRNFLLSKQRAKISLSIRRILLKNIFLSLLILTFGLSYIWLEFFFGKLYAWGITGRLAETTLYSCFFLVVPIFLLGQTVPLTSNYLSKERLSAATGRMLFFSTAGSFFGSVFSTIVLMSVIGVHNTVIVTLGLLALLGTLLSRKKQVYAIFLLVFIGGIIINSDRVMHYNHIVSDSAYNIVKVINDPANETVMLNINRSYAAKLTKDPEKRGHYLKYIENTFIKKTAEADGNVQEILIIGAGGFTIGLTDALNHYTYVDIDASLKEVAEKDFLKRKLLPNKQFVASSARAYVHHSNKKYDLIILDAYTNMYAMPMECTTREFLQEVKLLLKKNGVVVANIVSSPSFSDKFTVRYDNTFSSVFPLHSRQVINPFTPWDPLPHIMNVLYIYYNNAFADDKSIYTDDKNTYSLI